MFFKSIRFKAILLYTLILTITLLVFSFILYGGFSKTLYDDFDDLLSSRAEGVADSINAYWHGRGIADTRAENFDSIAKGWVEEKRKNADLMSIFVQILNPVGAKVVASMSMPRIAQLDKDDFADILGGEDSFDTLSGESADARKMKFRVYSKPVYIDGNVRYVVQVAGPMDLMSLALNSLIFILFILLPITVLLAAFPGVLLVRIALKPVDTMIDTLRQITAENLKLKIHIPDTKDEIKRLADTFNDMIERIDRSFSSQQRFIQDIYHELNTPLNILRTEIEMASGKAGSKAQVEAVFKRISKEIGEFSKIIDNLGALTRFENDQLALEIKKVGLTDLVEKILDEMKALAEEKEISTSFYSSEAVIIDGDESQLGRMLMNLLDNAIKYTYRRGKVIVTVNRDDLTARVTVSDTGIGMPDDELPYIFDRFYQVVKTRGSKSGFGIGLSVVRAVVEAHKGKISVESKRGQGSTFTVILPLSYPA